MCWKMTDGGSFQQNKQIFGPWMVMNNPYIRRTYLKQQEHDKLDVPRHHNGNELGVGDLSMYVSIDTLRLGLICTSAEAVFRGTHFFH